MGLLGGKEVLKVKGICPVSGLLGESEGLGAGDGLEAGVQGSRDQALCLGDSISAESRAVLKCTQDFGFI